MKIDIVVANKAEEARKYLEEGRCPVECSYGDVSVVDELELDHHGPYSHKPPVCIQALDLAGIRKDDPRFVVAGSPDADATYCIALLIGLIKPNLYVKRLAETIAKLDEGDFSEKTPESELVTSWKRLLGGADSEAWITGVFLWPSLIGPQHRISDEADQKRIEMARKWVKIIHKLKRGTIMFVSCPVWGFDVWYSEDGADVVVAYVEAEHRVTIGVKDIGTAERLFGSGGLHNVYRELDRICQEMKWGYGWGGKPQVGGSPRHLKADASIAVLAYELIKKKMEGTDEQGTNRVDFFEGGSE